jgi:hypothetical protein
MDRLIMESTPFSPGIILDHENKVFSVKGNSRPEDVREIYFPVVKWLHDYRLLLKNSATDYYSEEDPLIFEFDLEYFNSSTAKFLYDIVEALKQIKDDGASVGVAWRYDSEDSDMKEAGEDLSYLAEFDFAYITR